MKEEKLQEHALFKHVRNSTAEGTGLHVIPFPAYYNAGAATIVSGVPLPLMTVLNSDRWLDYASDGGIGLELEKAKCVFREEMRRSYADGVIWGFPQVPSLGITVVDAITK